MGGPGEGPKGPKWCKFQTSSSPDPKWVHSSNVVCRYLNMWRIKVVHGSSKDDPFGALQGSQRKNHIKGCSFSKIMITFKLNFAGIILMGKGYTVVQIVHVATIGARGGAHNAQKVILLSSSSKSIVRNLPNLEGIIHIGRWYKVVEMVHMAPMMALGGPLAFFNFFLIKFFSHNFLQKPWSYFCT